MHYFLGWAHFIAKILGWFEIPKKKISPGPEHIDLKRTHSKHMFQMRVFTIKGVEAS